MCASWFLLRLFAQRASGVCPVNSAQVSFCGRARNGVTHAQSRTHTRKSVRKTKNQEKKTAQWRLFLFCVGPLFIFLSLTSSLCFKCFFICQSRLTFSFPFGALFPSTERGALLFRFLPFVFPPPLLVFSLLFPPLPSLGWFSRWRLHVREMIHGGTGFPDSRQSAGPAVVFPCFFFLALRVRLVLSRIRRR